VFAYYAVLSSAVAAAVLLTREIALAVIRLTGCSHTCLFRRWDPDTGLRAGARYHTMAENIDVLNVQ